MLSDYSVKTFGELLFNEPFTFIKNMMIFYSRIDQNNTDNRQLLDDHLRNVGELSKEFSNVFGAGVLGELSGKFHDIGKYQTDFQRRLLFKSGADISDEFNSIVDHSTTGALYFYERSKELGKILAYIIAGHHAGLADFNGSNTSLSKRLEKKKLSISNIISDETILPNFIANIKNEDITKLILDALKTKVINNRLWLSFFIRMLFSCLIDADRLDSERFISIERFNQRKINYSFIEMKDVLMNHLSLFKSDTHINKIRKSILDRCITSAALPSGFFSLSATTGSGKTLSSIAFALHHLIKYNKKRIIYVIPFTSIIEQTANIFREVFKELDKNIVLEHHSNFDESTLLEEDSIKRNLVSENWDAPIIVTTNVQFLETLFSSRPSTCRKLHNIADSVIIFDEVQTLPLDFLQPIISAMKCLVESYKCSIVLSSATQITLNKRQDFIDGIEGIREITGTNEEVDNIYSSLKRTDINIVNNLLPISLADLAIELQKHESVLCIVDTRKLCRALYSEMPKGTYHLSALMCGSHRSKVIAEIKERLKNNKPVRVISTQLIEAGVDIDFPVVYRSITGIDSIEQARGRCNRENKLDCGKFFIFTPPCQSYGTLKTTRDVGTLILKNIMSSKSEINISRVEHKNYFHNLFFNIGGTFDKKGIMPLLENNDRLSFSFRTASERFKIIEDTKRPVVVLYKNDELINSLKAGYDSIKLKREAQRYSVSITEKEFDELNAIGAISETASGIFVQVSPFLYDEEIGLTFGTACSIMIV
jgi:CRISPR-associated endonuclease/helicase Cas3